MSEGTRGRCEASSLAAALPGGAGPGVPAHPEEPRIGFQGHSASVADSPTDRAFYVETGADEHGGVITPVGEFDSSALGPFEDALTK